MQLGRVPVHATVDPYADEPTFDMDVELVGLELTRVNGFMSAYGKVDVGNGKIVGNVKPMLKDVRLLYIPAEIRRDKDGPFRIAWEAPAGGAEGRLTNDGTGQLAIKVKFAGALQGPQVGTWPAVLSILRNAFVQAMFRGLDNEISPEDSPGAEGREQAE